MKQLPRDAAFVREQNGEIVDWGVAENLLATLVEVMVNVNRDPKKMRKPFEYPRPGVVSTPGQPSRQHAGRRNARRISMADMASMIGTT